VNIFHNKSTYDYTILVLYNFEKNAILGFVGVKMV